MKKHFLRILVVMLMACLGIGVMAACGDKKDEDPPVTYTVAFSLGSPSHAAEGVTAPPQQTGKKAGDTITLTTLDAAEDWKFDGWSAKSGKVSGTTYTVKAADAVEGTITLTAQWAEDGEPAPSSDIEGVWSGGTGDVADFTFTIDVDGDTAHVVMLRNADDSNFVCMYLQLTKSGDGNFGLNGVTLTVDGDGHLVYGTGMPGQSMTFTTKAPLPAAPNITGTKYALHLNETYMTEVFEINFGSTPAIKRNVTSATEVSDVITVGGYKILTGTMSLLEEGGGSTSSITVIAFTEQSKNYAAVLMGTHNRDRFDLVDTAPTFSVTYDNGDAGEEEAENMPGAVTQKYKLGQTYTISNTEPTWEGHDFKGWKANIGIGEGTPGGGSSVSGNDQLYHGGDTFTFTTPTNVTFIAQWEANGTPAPTTCTVTFAQGDHGTLTNGDPVSGKEANQQVPLPTVDPAKGYKLEGWYKGGNKVANADATNYTVTADDVQAGTITLTAQYEPIEYTVKFDVTTTYGNVTGEHGNATITITNRNVEFPTGLALTGYTLTGWKLGNAGETRTGSYEVTEAELPENSAAPEITFVAQWEAKTYQVALNKGANGELSATTVTATYGQPLTLPTPTANKGYKFDGWYTDETAGDKFNSNDTWQIDGTDLTLYARYGYLQYTVVFDKGTAEGEVTLPPAPQDKVSLEEGHNSITLSEVTCSGYVFGGWELNEHAIGKSGEYTLNAEHLPDNPADPAQAELTLTIKATWSPVGKVRVSYELGAHHADGAKIEPSSVEVEENTAVNLPDAPAAAPGYEFDAWYVKVTNEADSTEKAGDAKGTYQVGTEAVVLIGKFKAIAYTVKYVLDKPGDAQGSLTSETIAEDTISMEKPLDLPADPSGLTNYRFAGWTATGIDEAVKNSGSDKLTLTAEIIAGATEKNEITLTATWTKLYGVTYDDNAAEEEITVPTDTKMYAAGEEVTIEGDDPTRDYYVFKGWLVNGETKQKGDTVNMTEGGLTLTAQWDKAEYEVTYVYDEGTDAAAPEKQSYKWDEDVTLEVPAAKTGWKFNKWEVSGAEVTVSEENTFKMPKAAITVTAKFSLIEYTIEFAAGADAGVTDTIDPVTGITLTDKTVALKGKTFTRTGYALTGWEFNGTTYAADGTFELTEEIILANGDKDTITLTAQWTKEYTLKFYAEKDQYETPVEGGTITALEGRPISEAAGYDGIHKPTEENYTFEWYYMAGEVETKFDPSKKPEEIITDGAELNIYAKRTLNAEITLGTVEANGSWNTIYYKYPETLKMGEQLVFEADITANKVAENPIEYAGVFAAITGDANYATFDTMRYDVFDFSSTKIAEVNPVVDWTIHNESERNWVAEDMKLLLYGENVKVKTTITYFNAQTIFLKYEITSTFTPYLEEAKAEHHYTAVGIINNPTGEYYIGLCGEQATWSNATVTRTTHAEHTFTKNVCECGEMEGSFTVTYNNYTATVTKQAGYKNNDTDVAWWNVGGASDDIVLSDNMAIVFTWTKDVTNGGACDAAFELYDNFSSGSRYITVDLNAAAWGALLTTDQTPGPCTFTNTEFDSAVTNWEGSGRLEIYRIGTTIHGIYTHTTKDGVEHTRTFDITDLPSDLEYKVHINGNPFCCSNLCAATGTLSAND